MIEETSNEHIVSASVTKRKRKSVSVLRRTAATEYEEKQSVLGAQQPQAHGNSEIVTPTTM